MPRARERLEPRLPETNIGHRLITVLDVAGGAPQIPADVLAPSPNQIPAVLAQAEHDRPSGLFERVVHFLVHFANLADRIDLGGAAPIVFQIIYAPLGVSLGILLFMLVAARKSGARFRARRGINSEF